MEWVLRSPQIHSTFSNLGYAYTDGYHINENCNAALEEILRNILTEDKYFRAYRRNISFGQNVKKDLIPLLINAKEDKTIELLIEIFVNLSTPIECLFNVEDISKSDFGRHTLFEINNLLAATKTGLIDQRTTKVIIEFMKKNAEWKQKTNLPVNQCRNIGNSLLFLRNILHIPDDVNTLNQNFSGPTHTVQNQILWNLFSQSIDKVLIKLMTIPESEKWGVTMVQLVALLYKDQHVTTLHKLLNVWLESSLTESSEDNESNTSPPGRGRSEDSSPMLTSDPTSDSSDTGGSGKCNDESNSADKAWVTTIATANENGNQFKCQPPPDKTTDLSKAADVTSKKDDEKYTQNKSKKSNESTCTANDDNKTVIAENSDCGYGTQVENQESISTSSNEEDLPFKKPMHQNPICSKQIINNKPRASTATSQEKKRKKIVKRAKSNIINVNGLLHSTPTDDDISNVLKEFTVDFLLKGFNSLVKTLHEQILTNQQLEIDTSHFFWLITYFLKFATQINLELEHVCSVLSFDIISYLTAEGVSICEQFELAIKLDGNDLKPCIRRQHLVVTAIREFVQTVEMYKKVVHLRDEDEATLMELQIKMCEIDELRMLMLLLLRNYNPNYHSKQYLQDLIVTNHILLVFLDRLMKLPEYKGSANMVAHIKEFANTDTMYRYGLLLEDYEANGKFVNDCVFTVMHHVGGNLDFLKSLFQPSILKTFTLIWKSGFDICDDWSDLVQYVISTYKKRAKRFPNNLNLLVEPDCLEALKAAGGCGACGGARRLEPPRDCKPFNTKKSAKERWSEDEISSLSWNFMQCNTLPDVVGGIVQKFKEDGIKKSRESVLRELLKQSLITKDEFDKFMKVAMDSKSSGPQGQKEMRDVEILKLCEQIALDDKSYCLDWVQTLLLETCSVKVYLGKKAAEIKLKKEANEEGAEKLHPEEANSSSLPALSPVAYHSLLLGLSVPLVPYTCAQSAACKDLRFLQLLHKLGFHMPVDSGKLFIRIPNFWSAEFLYEVATKIADVDTSKLKFSMSDISESNNNMDMNNMDNDSGYNIPMELTPEADLMDPPDSFYRIHKQHHLANILNFIPMPGSSYNTPNIEINQASWLDMVRKSQEYKLNLCHRGVLADEDEDVHMAATADLVTCNDSVIMSVEHHTASYIGQLDSEFNNSICETASVASDLTRMYVSDEDDKSVQSEAPQPKLPAKPLEVSLHPSITDIRPQPHFPPSLLIPDRSLIQF